MRNTRQLLGVGAAVPIFRSAYNWRESAETMEVRKCSAMERLSSVFPTPVGPIRTIRVSGMVFIKRGADVTSAPVKINSFLAHKGPVRRHRPYQILRDQSLPYRSPGRRRNSRLYPDFRYCFLPSFRQSRRFVSGLLRLCANTLLCQGLCR